MTFNPFDVQKQMFAEFEKNLGEYLQKTMRDPTFMKMVAKNMSTNLDMRSVVKKQLDSMLQTLDVPTQESMANLYRTVHNLETRMLDLEEEVEELSDELKKVKKTKTTPSSAAKKSSASSSKSKSKSSGRKTASKSTRNSKAKK